MTSTNITLSFYKRANDNKGTVKPIADIFALFTNKPLQDITDVYRRQYFAPYQLAAAAFEKHTEGFDWWDIYTERRDALKKVEQQLKRNTTQELLQDEADIKQKLHHLASTPAIADALRLEEIYKETKQAAATYKETHFPAVTWSGVFTKRNADSLKQHSGLLCVDIDKLTQERHDALKKLLKNDPHVYFLFTSPSGVGLKLIFKIEPNANLQLSYFNSIAAYLQQEYAVNVDPLPKNRVSLCFICFDSSTHTNAAAIPFTLTHRVDEPETPPTLTPTEQTELTSIDTLEAIWTFTERKATFADGSKNHFINLFAWNCNLRGIDIEQCTEYVFAALGEREEKAKTAIRSCYNSQSAFHGKYAKRSNKNGTATKAGTHQLPAQSTTVNQISSQVSTTTQEPGAKTEYTLDDELFWYTAVNEKTGKETLSLIYGKFFDFFEEQGFCNLGSDTQENLELIRIQDGVVKPIIINKTRNDAKAFINKFCKDNRLGKVHEMLHRGEDKYFSRSKFTNLKSEKIEFLRDTAESSFYFHSNCMVEVSKRGIKTRPYKNGEKHLWRSQIIDKPFKQIDLEFGVDKDGRYIPEQMPCDWAKFQLVVSTNPNKAAKMDPKDVNYRFYAHATSFGHLINDYKGPTCKGIIGVDHKKTHDRSEQNGGTGKGRFAEALGFVKRTYEVDGQNFDPKNKSVFEQVTMDTKIITVVDCGPNFDFRYFFNMLTSKFTFHKMYVGPVTIPFEDSPKFYFDTNFSFKGDGTSFRRRQHVIEFDDFFNEEHTPLDYFGHPLFRSWDADEWNRFYNYCYWCDMMYKTMGLVDYPQGNYLDRKLGNEVPTEFVDFLDAEEINPSGNPVMKGGEPVHIIKRSGDKIGVAKHKKLDIYNAWKTQAEQFGMTKTSAKQFTSWMQKYCSVRGLQYITDKKGGVEYAWISDGTIEPDKLKLMGELQFQSAQ